MQSWLRPAARAPPATERHPQHHCLVISNNKDNILGPRTGHLRMQTCTMAPSSSATQKEQRGRKASKKSKRKG